MAVGQRTVGVRRYRWTAKELYKLLDGGFFKGKRVELIEGVIYQMASQRNFHALGIEFTRECLANAFGPAYWVRVQASLDLTPYSVPDPDLAVIAGSARANATPTNPTSALLIVEVSDTTLSYDRGLKAELYARVGIQDYWVLNLVQRQLEVFRVPVADSSRRLGFRYDDKTILLPSAVVSPLAVPHAQIKVVDLLP
jgi:Uma2 family endonuclease